MITIKDFMEVVDYKITEGSEYQWNCFGRRAYRLDSWSGALDQDSTNGPNYSIGIIFDTETQIVYQFESHDYNNERSYRWTNPEYVDSYKAEVQEKLGSKDKDVAYDNVKFTDIEISKDILSKSKAIFMGKEYDTRIQVPIDLEDNELLILMKLAHEQDITLNKLVENILTKVIERDQANGS